MLNVLIIDSNNNADFWHQQFKKIILPEKKYALTVQSIEKINHPNNGLQADCIWHNGELDEQHSKVQSIQKKFPNTPIFKIKKNTVPFTIEIVLPEKKSNYNLDKIIRGARLTPSNKSISKAEIKFQGIMSCISDIIFIYDDNEIIFNNARAQLLMSNTENKAFDAIKKNTEEKKNTIIIPEANDICVYNIHYIPTEWHNKPSTMAILHNITEQEKEKTELTHQLQNHVDAFTKVTTELDKNQTRLQLLLKSAGEGFWDWHILEGEVFLSHRWKEMLGYDDGDISDTFNDWANLIHPDDLGNFLLQWSQFMESDLDTFNVEYRILCKSGDYSWVEARGVKEVDDNGKAIRLAGSHIDINKRKKIETELNLHQNNLEEIIAARTKELEDANRMLENLAKLDGLTELANRRCLDETLAQEVLRANRDKSNLCLLMLDIDFFKNYNDKFGHQEGDRCLRIIAKTISDSLLRPSDMAGRYGGEEFSVVLPSTNIDGGTLIAQQIVANIARIKNLKLNPHTKYALTLSIGVACSTPDNRLTAEELVCAADNALYTAKNNGRNQIACYQ